MSFWQRIRQSRLEHAVRGVERTLTARMALADADDGDCMVRLMRYVLRRGDHCIDVGAHNGGYLRYFCELAPDGRHVAFEPLPYFAGVLREKFPDVEVHEAALADEPGQVTFHHVATNPGLSGIRRREDLSGNEEVKSIDVEVKRLDDVVDPDRPVRFIKVDVEGAELGVFQGAAELIRRQRPYLVFEHGNGAPEAYGTTPEMLHELLVGEFGLAIFRMDGAGPLGRGQFADIVTGRTAWNFIARPY